MTIKSFLPGRTRMMCVIKDNAYGHGLIETARQLKEDTDMFCVARLSEAKRLRKKGIHTPILVFEIPPRGSESDYIKYKLTATIGNLEVIRRLNPETWCHINLDTGMNRLGIKPYQIDKLKEAIVHRSDLNIKGIYTHFANADYPDHPMTGQQLGLFRKMRNQFPQEWMAHTANSGALLYHRKKEIYFDAVRPGLALYGFCPGKSYVPGLDQVIKLKSSLVNVKKIKKGEAVGYGSTFKAREDGYIGIIPVGYGDGLPRILSNKIEVRIGGNYYPQVGTISMDYCTVWLGTYQAEEGEDVYLLDDDARIDVQKWADISDTIPYEICTGLSPELRRSYIID